MFWMIAILSTGLYYLALYKFDQKRQKTFAIEKSAIPKIEIDKEMGTAFLDAPDLEQSKEVEKIAPSEQKDIEPKTIEGGDYLGQELLETTAPSKATFLLPSPQIIMEE